MHSKVGLVIGQLGSLTGLLSLSNKNAQRENQIIDVSMSDFARVDGGMPSFR